MKVRHGFVSNSSSSSFVICIKKDAFENALKNLLPFQRDMLLQIYSTTNVLGIPCYTRSEFNTAGYSFYEYDEDIPWGEPFDGKDQYDKDYEEDYDDEIPILYDFVVEWEGQFSTNDSYRASTSDGG